MRTLIIKLNAAGDVVRTTPLLHRLPGHITWITASSNLVLLKRLPYDLHCLTWEHRSRALNGKYDLVINLEDEPEVAAFAGELHHDRLFGAYLDSGGRVLYTRDAGGWFDLGLVSTHGKRKADELKFVNRRTYQDLVFEGLGFRFIGEPYLLPPASAHDLAGDVAIAPIAGPVWPMKSWAYYDNLKVALEAAGLTVNILPRRPSLLAHIADVKNHRCLVSGDSLPMHLALATGTRCVTIFNCTSPWEIYDYGLQTKVVSPLLGDFFYHRGFDERATTAVRLDEVFDCVMLTLQRDEPSHVL